MRTDFDKDEDSRNMSECLDRMTEVAKKYGYRFHGFISGENYKRGAITANNMDDRALDRMFVTLTQHPKTDKDFRRHVDKRLSVGVSGDRGGISSALEEILSALAARGDDVQG